MDRFYYMSFADTTKPEGAQYLGSCVVRIEATIWPDVATDKRMLSAFACRLAWRYGCNPGGQVLGGLVPEDVVVPPAFLHRLLTREDVEAMDAAILGPHT